MEAKRFIVHDFLIGNPILIDRKECRLVHYSTNLYGQLCYLKDAPYYSVSTSSINGLIRRTHNKYSYKTSKAIDSYIYTYLMTPEQQAQCRAIPYMLKSDHLIVATDDFAEAITKMCEWSFEENYPNRLGDKEDVRYDKLKYCRDYLAENPTAPWDGARRKAKALQHNEPEPER